MLRKGFKATLSKQQISNVFANQEALHPENVSPLTAIDIFSGAHSWKIKADFYNDCQDISDLSTLDPMQKNLMLLNDCFLGKQIKQGCTTGVDTTTVIRYTLHRTTSVYLDIQFERIQTLLSCSHKM